jgi:hypothetical protein
MSSASLSTTTIREASPPSFVPSATVREILFMAVASLVLMVAEVATSSPRILFARYLWIDELWTKFIVSRPSVCQSLVVLKHGGDGTPPVYHLLARAWWGLVGGSAETALRALSFVSMWVAVVLLYVLLRRTFTILPALVAVLAFWSSGAIIGYAFYARTYASLLAAIVGFCLIYGRDKKEPLAFALTAAMAALVCTLHYFGIFAIGAAVLGDTLARREPPPAMVRRWLPAAAGPIALACCWPFLHGWQAGLRVFSAMPPETLGSAMKKIFFSWSVAFEATAILILAWCVSTIIWLISRVSRYGGEKAPSTNIGPFRPVAGLLGTILVPILVAVFSAFVMSAMLIRYMIPSLLGVTVLLAFVASKTSPRVLGAAAMLLLLLGWHNLQHFSEAEMRWQATADQMMKIGQNDELPVVTLSLHEAHLLYEYSPDLRSRLFLADLRESYGSQLYVGALSEYEAENKWLKIYPDLPKLVSLDQLRQMGKFHLVNPEPPVLAEQENRPSESFPLQKIAQVLSFERVGDLYEVRP